MREEIARLRHDSFGCGTHKCPHWQNDCFNDDWVIHYGLCAEMLDQVLFLIRERIKKSLLTDEEIDTTYVDGWASRNTEVDDPLGLKSRDGHEEIDVLRELAQAQIANTLKEMEK
jgi:hypothetical protein